MEFFNSKEVAWADMEVFLNGKKITKIKNVKYTKKQEKEALYAADDEPHSIQRGNKIYSGEVELYKSAVDQINAAAALAGFEDLLDLQGLIFVVSYKPTITRPLIMDTLLDVEFTEYEKDMKQGDKFMVIKLPFLFLRLKSVP